MVEAVPDAFGVQLYDFCFGLMTAQHLVFGDDAISVPKITELLLFARRDLKRIAEELRNGISRQKFAAYYAFWFAKLAPVSAVYAPDGVTEIVDISERLAVYLMYDLMTRDAAEEVHDNVTYPLVWARCEYTCTGDCFVSGFQNFIRFYNGQQYEYVVRLLRHRPAGPYTLVTIIESVLIASCKSTLLPEWDA